MKGRQKMIILKLLIKVILIPVILVLFLLKIALKIGMEISSIVLGGLILITLGCMIYTITKQEWSQTFVLFLMEAGFMLITLTAGIMEDLVDAAISLIIRI